MINVIPYPAEITKKQGYFLMPETVRVSAENDSLFKMISNILSKRYNTVKAFDKPVLSVVSDPSLPAEGYVLDIEEGGLSAPCVPRRKKTRAVVLRHSAGDPRFREELRAHSLAGKESTFEFIFDIIDELTQLFPSEYFHIGGDEAPKDEWKKCPHCQAKIKSEGLKDEEDLQFYFNKRISDYLKSKGKTLICWNDALHFESYADASIVCQYYTYAHDAYVEKHLSAGGKAVISKFQGFYFDMCYKDVPLKNAYKFDVLQNGITENAAKNIQGVECTLWTEWIPDKEKLDFQMYPRLEACAERGIRISETPPFRK